MTSKKIAAAFDGLKYSLSTRDYAVLLAKLVHAHLVGIFLENPMYTSYNLYDLMIRKKITQKSLKLYKERDKIERSNATENFEKVCKDQKVEFTVHHDRSIALLDLKHESMYTDMLVIDAAETLTHYPEKLPTRFISELLRDIQCPVLLVPKKYKPFKRVIMLYDGKPSSLYAIKMFSYILPQFRDVDTEILTVKSPDDSLHLPNNKLFKEFIKRHFSNVHYTILQGVTAAEIEKHFAEMKEEAIIVLGAYQRSGLSQWFRESMVDSLMKVMKYPLFIAHQ